jgi:hypothetical protein
MRLESKHSFFKRSGRTAQNFINVGKTLSVTHQLYQSYLSTGQMVSDDGELSKDCIEFARDSCLFAHDIVMAIEQCYQLVPPVQCAFNMTVKGTEYRQGNYVICHVVDTVPQFGKIELCLLDHSGASAVVVNMCDVQYESHLGAYKSSLPQSNKSLLCMFIKDLADYQSLSGYEINSATYIVLKHAFLVTVSA